MENQSWSRDKITKPKQQKSWVVEEDVDYETPVDKDGMKTKVVFSIKDGKKIKTTSRIKVVQVVTKIPKRVVDRRLLSKFGEATKNDVNVTMRSAEFVYLEHPDDALTEDNNNKLGSEMSEFVRKMEERKQQRIIDGDGAPDDQTMSGPSDESPRATGGSGSYVPPSMRNREGGAAAGSTTEPNRDYEMTIRVNNLSTKASEEDLRDLFGRFGSILRVSLPRHAAKIDPDTGAISDYREPKGFAYVAFTRRDDAQKAMDALQSYGYDHLILKLEWAKPPTDAGAASTGGGRGHMSGYGQKLAQDTKEKVVYSSNLTQNK